MNPTHLPMKAGWGPQPSGYRTSSLLHVIQGTMTCNKNILYETIIPPYGTGANTQASSLCYHAWCIIMEAEHCPHGTRVCNQNIPCRNITSVYGTTASRQMSYFWNLGGSQNTSLCPTTRCGDHREEQSLIVFRFLYSYLL